MRNSSLLITDPTSFEEPLLDATLSIVLDENDQVIQTTQLGSGVVEHEDPLLACITAAKQRRRELADTS